MKISAYLKSALLGCTCAIALTAIAYARDFNIPSGDLESALNAYTAATGVDLIVASDAIKGVRTKGATGALSADDALSRLLVGTGFRAQRQSSGAIAIVHGMTSSVEDVPMQLAQAAPARAPPSKPSRSRPRSSAARMCNRFRFRSRRFRRNS